MSLFGGRNKILAGRFFVLLNAVSCVVAIPELAQCLNISLVCQTLHGLEALLHQAHPGLQPLPPTPPLQISNRRFRVGKVDRYFCTSHGGNGVRLGSDRVRLGPGPGSEPRSRLSWPGGQSRSPRLGTRVLRVPGYQQDVRLGTTTSDPRVPA
eukprot:1718026-Rhodomonas_salina.2